MLAFLRLDKQHKARPSADHIFINPVRMELFNDAVNGIVHGFTVDPL